MLSTYCIVFNILVHNLKDMYQNMKKRLQLQLFMAPLDVLNSKILFTSFQTCLQIIFITAGALKNSAILYLIKILCIAVYSVNKKTS